MSKLPDKYDAKIIENKWRHDWQKNKIYQWKNDLPKNQTFVIDTPPPTVSGLLHMGHVFSYTQADFVARYNRMSGKDVFYPMGFDDNGLPTERLVEKIIGKKAGIYENENGRGSFVTKCREVVDEAEKEFEILFNEIALSVDWEQKYQTISPESQKISQASFVDLFHKGLVEKQNQPVFWDISDRTALAQADIIDKEVEGEMYFFDFAIQGNANNLEIMTTRPELLPACVAVMINGQDERYQNLILKPLNQEGEGETGSFALTPIFGVKVPIIADNSVQLDKGTGVVMCCTFGDETDVEWWEKYNLPLRAIIGESGILGRYVIFEVSTFKESTSIEKKEWEIFAGNIHKNNCQDVENFVEVFRRIVEGNTLKKTRELIINELSEILSKSSVFNSPLEGESKSQSDFGGGSEKNFAHSNSSLENKIKSQKITRPVKCAERSGVPIEFLIRPQWYIKIRDKKDKLKQKSRECNWYPEYMRVRIEQWIDGLSRDWCISRQRFFGVKFPVWYSKRKGEEGKILVASLKQLPCDPFIDLPEGYSRDEVSAETDIMDTWATSSISPQLSSKGISDEIYFDEKSQARHQKLFPADMRPQAHEIIRTWAFYTITKAYLHSLNRVKNVDGTFAKNVDGSIKLQENINDEISLPWKNLMISGWCLASDKTKMSKSKGNVVTPTALIQEKSADVVRYWASASNLGADIAYSEDVFKIGQKLITKLFNSAKFCSQHFAVLEEYFGGEAQQSSSQNSSEIADEKLANLISETADIWIILRLKKVIENYQKQFAIFEYARAREVVEEFFWKDFCDNYLEICKVRSYGLSAEKIAGVELDESQKQQIIAKQLSSIATLSLCLKNILKLLAPFIPHITEEIYATIFHDEFAQKKSIHARGNFAKLPENLSIINQENIEKIGEELLAIIFEVRKFKSEKNLSMKVPIAILEISSKLDLSSVSEDLLNVTNSQKIEFNESENLVKVIIS
jgi:valyl-tRNA synthetase